MKFQRNRNHNRIFANPKRHEGEAVVQNDLAVTPTRMYEMMQQGIPISTQNLSDEMFYDGDTNPSFDLPLDMQRGIDVADCWEASMDIKSRAKKGLKRDKNVYGNNPQKSE